MIVAAPPPDIQSAAARLAPAGAHVFLAQELDATLGVVAWTAAGRPAALALRWSDGRWSPARPGRLTLRPVPRRIHGPYLLDVRGAAYIWVDGRPATDRVFDHLRLAGRRGVHTIVELATTATYARARASTYTVA